MGLRGVSASKLAATAASTAARARQQAALNAHQAQVAAEATAAAAVSSAVGALDIASIDGLQDALDALQTDVDGKALLAHTHAIADVTGLQTALDARMRRYSTLIGDGVATSIAVTHSLNTRDVVVQVYDAAAYTVITPTSITRTDANTVTLGYGAAPALNAHRVVVMG
jgi:hypothetical protein